MTHKSSPPCRHAEEAKRYRKECCNKDSIIMEVADARDRHAQRAEALEKVREAAEEFLEHHKDGGETYFAYRDTLRAALLAAKGEGG